MKIRIDNKKFKLAFGIICIIAFTATSALANGLDSSPLKKIFISKEESEENLNAGTQEALESQKLRETEEEILKKEYPKSGKVFPNETSGGNSSIIQKPLVSDEVKKKLSKEKKAELLFWETKGNSNFGEYKRKIKQIIGEVPANAKRVTLSEAKEIVSHNDFKTAVDKIEKLHTLPDFEGGSGVTIKEYWLDENGKEKILVIVEQNQIFRVLMRDESHQEKSELLN